MNSLNQNPKKTMFYAAAQNMLNQHSNQSSMQNLKRSLFQLALIPSGNYRDQLNHSVNNHSDRAQENYSIPKRSVPFQIDKDRSLSYKQHMSFENNSSVERLKNAYNIKGHFQVMNEDPNQVVEKEQKKLELKEYLLKQIEEKKKQQWREQETSKIEDAKAEQLVRKQLEEIKWKQKQQSEQYQSQDQYQLKGSIWLIYYYIRKMLHFQLNQVCNHIVNLIRMVFLCRFIICNPKSKGNRMIFQTN